MFDLTDDDEYAIDVMRRVGSALANRKGLPPEHAASIRRALAALDRLPKPTPGLHVEYGVCYRTDGGMRCVEFLVSDWALGISPGGSDYDDATGGDSFSEPGWRVEVDGYREDGEDLQLPTW